MACRWKINFIFTSRPYKISMERSSERSVPNHLVAIATSFVVSMGVIHLGSQRSVSQLVNSLRVFSHCSFFDGR